MFKKEYTRLLVENWRKFINEGDQDTTQSVKICQALMTKEGVKKFASKFAIDDIDSINSIKSAKQIFQVSKAIVNMLIIGPVTVRDTIKDYERGEVESDSYFIMFFRDDQGSNNEHVYPQKLANWMQSNGSREIGSHDINQLYKYARQKNIDIKKVVKTNQVYNSGLYEFCKNAMSGSAQKLEGVEVLEPIIGQIKSASAYSTNNKELSNASVYK